MADITIGEWLSKLRSAEFAQASSALRTQAEQSAGPKFDEVLDAAVASAPETPTAGFQPDGSIAVYDAASGWTSVVPLGGGAYGSAPGTTPAPAPAPTNLTNPALPPNPTAGFQPDGSIAVYDANAGWQRVVPLGPSGINGGTAYGTDPNAAPTPAGVYGSSMQLDASAFEQVLGPNWASIIGAVD